MSRIINRGGRFLTYSKSKISFTKTILGIVLVVFIAAIITNFSSYTIQGYRVLFNGDITSAHSLLSTLPQSLAALFAIFFSILIVVAQFSASKYSADILKISLQTIFEDSQVLATIFFFFSAIFLSFILGANLTDVTLSNEIRFLISVTVILTCLALAFIISLFWRVQVFLNPMHIISQISSRLKGDVASEESETRVRTIAEIVKKELKAGNIIFATQGLDELGDIASATLHAEKLQQDFFGKQESKESADLRKKLASIQNLNRIILDEILDISKSALELSHISVAVKSVAIFGQICSLSIDLEVNYQAIARLTTLGTEAHDRTHQTVNVKIVMQVMQQFEDLIQRAEEQGAFVGRLTACANFVIMGSYYHRIMPTIAFTKVLVSRISAVNSKLLENAREVLLSSSEDEQTSHRILFGGADPLEVFSEFFSTLSVQKNDQQEDVNKQ